ncbi:MAG: hypothetical protein IKI13_08815 [Bacteroidales bacterium]|nr:hypothetical protein [Bacteroidales bacterium]
MKNWEDIIKDKLEGYESPLPEGSLAEFRARREAAGSPAPSRRSPLIWIVPAAVAAGLAAFLFLGKPGTTDEGIRTIQQPTTPVAAVTDSTDSTDAVEAVEPAPVQPLIAQAVTPKTTRQPAVSRPATETETQTATAGTDTDATAGTEPEEAANNRETQAEAAVPNETVGPAQEGTTIQTPRTGGNNSITPYTPQIPEVTVSKQIGIKVGPAVGVVAGGGLLAAAIPILASLAPDQLGSAPEMAILRLASASPLADYAVKSSNTPPPGSVYYYIASSPGQPSGNHQSPTPEFDYSVTDAEHNIPLKLGLSARIPVSDRLSVVTGLQYSKYLSKVSLKYSNYRYDYERTQNVHYLGIPVRLDWMLASGRWLDVYLGGGIEGDYCLGATLNHDLIETKDGLSFSLLGAGGVQFNINRRVGLYLEPELSWTAPSRNRVLATYRSENPLMFSLATGLRINL